jgi:cytochrome c-type biogenesis protein CcmE
MKRKRMILGSVVVLGTLGFLVYSGVRDTMVYYVTPSELMAKVQAGTITEKDGLRVSGQVVAGSVKWDARQFRLTFKMTDGAATFLAMYDNVAPDNLESGEDVILEGTYKPDGHFMANKVLVKCPSKYDIEDETQESE